MRKLFFLFVAALCCALTIHATEGALPGALSNKFLRDGQLFIQRGDELFNAQGARVK